jgi:hypothetical protein
LPKAPFHRMNKPFSREKMTIHTRRCLIIYSDDPN